VDVLFLDANVHFSAAYRAEAGLRRFWQLPGVDLVTSAYAAEEAPAATCASSTSGTGSAPCWRRGERRLAAAGGRDPSGEGPADRLRRHLQRATHLITGDASHFGVWYGKTIAGMLVLRPAAYLEAAARRVSG
jgi:uncharacterized protein